MATKNALLIKIRDMKGFLCSTLPPSLSSLFLAIHTKKCQHELPAETSFLFLNLSTCLLTAGAAASEKNKCAYNAFMSYIVMMIRPCDFKLLSSKTLIKEMNLSYIFFCKFLQIFCSRRRLKCKCWSQLKGVDFTHGKMISKDMREGRISNGKLNHMKCNSQCEC